MKTTITKFNKTPNSHSSKPFFNIGGKGTFFSKSQDAKAPLFPSSSIQPKSEIQMKDSGSGSAAKKATLAKKTLPGSGTGDCGVFLWPIHWELTNATNHTNGWIVQKVELSNKIEDCNGNKIDAEKSNGLKPSWYPVWEAWKVAKGVIYAGGSNIPVSKVGKSDVFGQQKIGDKTKGETIVKGTAEFYENLTLPSSFKVTNKPPAHKLPSTDKDPKLTGGSGSIPHSIKATWDCCNTANKRTKTQII